MVMAPSHPVAGYGVQNRGAEEAKADGYEENIEHENLVRSREGDYLGLRA